MMKVKQFWQKVSVIHSQNKLTKSQFNYVYLCMLCLGIMFGAGLINATFDLPDIDPALFIHPQMLWVYDLSRLLLIGSWSACFFLLGRLFESTRRIRK